MMVSNPVKQPYLECQLCNCIHVMVILYMFSVSQLYLNKHFADVEEFNVALMKTNM